MKKGIILNFKHFGLFNYVTRNKIFILLCSIFITGIVISSVALSKNNWIFKSAKSFLEDYFLLHNTSTFFSKFTSSIIRYIVILVLYFLSGASMLGVALIPFLTLWLGIFYGALSSQLYSLHGIGGIAFNAIIIIPPTAIFILCCFFAARHSLDFSFALAKLTLPHSKPINLYTNFKNYCSKYLIILGVSLICVFLEIVLNLFFLKFFNF